MDPTNLDSVREPARRNERFVRALVALLVPLVLEDIQADKSLVTDGELGPLTPVVT
jgi:hypothetical protein